MAVQTKLQLAVQGYLQALVAPEMEGYTVHAGMRDGDQPAAVVTVAVVDRKPLYESEEDGGWKCVLVVGIETPPEFRDTASAAEEAHDACAGVVEAALIPALLMAFANSENTDRPVQSFHVGPFKRPQVASNYWNERKCFLTVISFLEVPCQDDDGDAL